MKFSVETMSLRPGARAEVRRSRYKVAVDADEGRRRREDNLVEIRKNKREESLLKKRREGQPQFTAAFPSPLIEKKVDSSSIIFLFLNMDIDCCVSYVFYAIRLEIRILVFDFCFLNMISDVCLD